MIAMQEENVALIFHCPVEAALEAIGGKWKPVIIWHLSQGELRFGELRRAIPRVTEKVLIEHLRQLERSGVISRSVVETVPPQVTYALTPHGSDLRQAIAAMCDWGIQHAERIGAQILIVDSRQTEKKLGATQRTKRTNQDEIPEITPRFGSSEKPRPSRLLVGK